eukprot:jgi/Tetstr1/432037/TSEL_021510.t1
MAARSAAGERDVAPAAAVRGSDQAGMFRSIPIIDLSRLRESNAGQRAALLSELREVCHTVGFMYVTNHGVGDEVCARALQAAGSFFALPQDAKMAFHHSSSPAFRGYIAKAAENTGGLADLREQVEFGVESEAVRGPEAGTMAGVFPVYRRLIGPNQWPDEALVSGFRGAIEAFMEGMHTLSLDLMGALMEALYLPANALDDTIGDTPNMQMKIARYPPPQTEDQLAGSKYGVGPHTDSGYLSILLQDAVGGLQVRNGAGQWVDAPPVPGALVVNLGEMLQLASAGFYLATEHRVQPPPAGGPARLSVPYFFNPKLDAQISALQLPSSLEWARPPPASLSESSTHAGRNKLLSQYGDNAFKSLARSHPAVLAAHHPDLEISKEGLVQPRGGAAREAAL